MPVHLLMHCAEHHRVDRNVGDTALTGTGVTSDTSSVRLNLFYSPVKNLSFGGEITHAIRELESGVDGTMDRLQFTAKLGF